MPTREAIWQNGVERRGGKLRIYFNYNGEKCREPLGLGLGLGNTPENVTYAQNVVATVQHKIKPCTFDYSKHFPESSRLAELTFGRYADIWLCIKKDKSVAWRMWVRSAGHVIICEPNGGEWWANHLNAAVVRYHGPSQCRHTFISQMLTIGIPINGIIAHVAHTSEAMLRKHYGRFIREDQPVSVAELANKPLGFGSISSPEVFWSTEYVAHIAAPTTCSGTANTHNNTLLAAPKTCPSILSFSGDIAFPFAEQKKGYLSVAFFHFQTQNSPILVPFQSIMP